MHNYLGDIVSLLETTPDIKQIVTTPGLLYLCPFNIPVFFNDFTSKSVERYSQKDMLAKNSTIIQLQCLERARILLPPTLVV